MRAPDAVVVPNHSLGSEVTCFVASKARWRYAMGLGSEEVPKSSFSASRAQKWIIKRDHSLHSSVSCALFKYDRCT